MKDADAEEAPLGLYAARLQRALRRRQSSLSYDVSRVSLDFFPMYLSRGVALVLLCRWGVRLFDCLSID